MTDRSKTPDQLPTQIEIPTAFTLEWEKREKLLAAYRKLGAEMVLAFHDLKVGHQRELIHRLQRLMMDGP